MNIWKKIVACLVIFALIWAFAITEGQAQPKKLDEENEENQDEEAEKDEEGEEEPEEPPMSAEEMLTELQTVNQLMKIAAEWLNDSSRGNQFEREKSLMEKVQEVLKKNLGKNYDPQKFQGRILAIIQGLLNLTADKQNESIEHLTKVINELEKLEQKGQQQQQSQGKGKSKKKGKQGKKPGKSKPQGKPGKQPAPQPYDPSAVGSPNPFKSDKGAASKRWGELPESVREAIEAGHLSVEDFPFEYRELLTEYFRKISEAKEAGER